MVPRGLGNDSLLATLHNSIVNVMLMLLAPSDKLRVPLPLLAFGTWKLARGIGREQVERKVIRKGKLVYVWFFPGEGLGLSSTPGLEEPKLCRGN